MAHLISLSFLSTLWLAQVGCARSIIQVGIADSIGDHNSLHEGLHIDRLTLVLL